jgi:oxygen-independent coproporphyrinogen-3 oxidase
LTAKGQRLYSENDLPETQTKLQMHKLAKEFLEKSAYQQVGMDHFCLESDSLFKSYQTGKMHRNFMGYTTDNSQLLIGLGVSSISDCGIAYAQNHKTIEEYKLDILAQNLPFLKAYCLSDKDLYFKEIIENLMCNYQSDIDSSFWERISENSLRKLEEMQSEGLIKIETDHIQVVEKGMPFVRNICASIDPYQAVESSGRKFSKAI